MRCSRFCLIPAALLVLAHGSGCGPAILPPSSYFGDWPTHGGNFERSNTVNARLTLPLEEAWRTRAGKGIRCSAVPVGSLVIVSTTDGKIRSHSIEDGEKIWQTKIKGSFIASPSVSNGKVYVSSEYPDGTLYCLDIRRGKIVWKRGIGACRSTSTIEGGILYTVNNAGELFAHNGATGDLLWKNDAGSFPPQSPIVRGDSLFITRSGEELSVLSTVDGKELARIDLTGSAYPSLTLVDNRFYYGSETGVGVTSVIPGPEPGGSREPARAYTLAVSGEVLLVSDGTREVSAREIESFEALWSRKTSGLIEAAPIILHDMAVVVTLAGEILILDIGSGRTMWEIRLKASISSPPAVAGNRLLVTTERGELIAFSSPENAAGASTGQVR